MAATRLPRRLGGHRDALPRTVSVAALFAPLLLAPPARAENRVEVHGTYFREESTRIVQPMLSVSTDLPHGLDLQAHGLVDAITSASLATGASADELFTETRKEARIGLGKTWDHTRVGGSYRQSREPDYISHSAVLSASRGVWDNSGLIGVNAAYAWDTIGPNLNLGMKTWFAGVTYEQGITPTLLVQASYEAFFHEGFLGNVYLRVPNLGRERPPGERLRHALAARIATYRPEWRAGAQLHFRFYIDQDFGLQLAPWGIMSNTIEGRIYKELGRFVEVRASYRVHAQGSAKFWCNSDPSQGGRTDCFGAFPAHYSADVKLGKLATHIPELKLYVDLGFVRGAPGTVDLSYGHYFQSTRYGGAHLAQLGYTLPF